MTKSMVPQTIVYETNLRCTATHKPSGSSMHTDAPVDNHGKGESFSPTDLVATALASCILTTMGIHCEPEGIRLDGSRIAIEKHMSTDTPRRIAKLVLSIDMCAGIPIHKRPTLERIARTCPVQKSIHPEIVIDLSIRYPD